MQDSNLILRDGSANLTASETGVYNGGTFSVTPGVDGMTAGAYSGGSLTSNGFLDLGKGGVLNYLDVEGIVPSQSGTSPTLDLQLQFSDDGTNVSEYEDMTGGATITSASTFPVVLMRRVVTRHRYLRYNAVLTGTTPNFGKVSLQISSGLSFRQGNVPNT